MQESIFNHTNKIPDYFIDNDKNKWGKKLLGVEIKPPTFLTDTVIKHIDKIIITTGYVKSVFPQLIKLGVSENKIEIPLSHYWVSILSK